jgi:hypothetical protein
MDLSGGLNELTDGTDGSVDTVTGAETGPYRESRLTRHRHGALELMGRPGRAKWPSLNFEPLTGVEDGCR